ncbi:hypothetical protein BJ878DRAFT_537696 [Calycina marina]|uniref:Uncharacterized protein n=1 Tax=Calycina marina TaxID=1763456 RepID=A0A9P7ZCC7_9HELO|nr:hypothetical protein BJ878DRAFT_537696 [Calycina marina]
MASLVSSAETAARQYKIAVEATAHEYKMNVVIPMLLPELHDCQDDNPAKNALEAGHLPKLHEFRDIIRTACDNDHKCKDPEGKLYSSVRINDIIASLKGEDREVPINFRFRFDKDDKPETRKSTWRHHVKTTWADLGGQYLFKGMTLNGHRLGLLEQAADKDKPKPKTAPSWTSFSALEPLAMFQDWYNILLAAHYCDGQHLGREKTMCRVQEVACNIATPIIKAFISACPHKTCRSNARIGNANKGNEKKIQAAKYSRAKQTERKESLKRDALEGSKGQQRKRPRREALEVPEAEGSAPVLQPPSPLDSGYGSRPSSAEDQLPPLGMSLLFPSPWSSGNKNSSVNHSNLRQDPEPTPNLQFEEQWSFTKVRNVQPLSQTPSNIGNRIDEWTNGFESGLYNAVWSPKEYVYPELSQ